MMRQKQLRIAKDKEKFYKTCVDMEAFTGKPVGDYENLRQFILKGEFEIVQASSAYNLGAMFNTAFMVLEELRYFGYEALYAPKGKLFMTSDSPVFTLQPDGSGQAAIGVGFGWPDVEVYFPLNKRTCLRLKRGIEPQGRFVSQRRVDQVNNLVMATANQFLYSSEGYRRITRLFDERGCRVRMGKEAFLRTPPASYGTL
jgi:hypothetical protein